MSDQKQQRATEVFEALCATMKEENWNYEINDPLHLTATARGDDLPIDLHVMLDAEMEVIVAFSFLPYEIPEDKRVDIAIAISAVNNQLAIGCFEFDPTQSSISFTLVNSFSGFIPSKELFCFLLYAACKVVDTYNDQFLMLIKDTITLEQFLNKQLNQGGSNE